MREWAALAASTLASPTLPGKARRIASSTEFERHDADKRGEGAEQRGVGRGPVDVFQRQLGRGNRAGVPARQARDRGVEMDFGKTARGVDDEIAVRREAFEHIERFEQGGVLHDQRVRRLDRLAQPDFRIRDAAEGDDRRARALGAEARKSLRVLAFQKRRDGEHLRRRHHALAAAAMYAHLKHPRSRKAVR